MAFRRSVDPNVRRRRVLKDEPVAAQDEATEATTSRRSRASQKSYAEAALADYQPRVTDLIPVRGWHHTVLFLLAVVGIALVQSLFLQLDTWSEALGHQNLTAFDLNQRGSVASWLSSLLLGGAFACSVLVFSIRRHKVNDYRGRYRVWILSAFVLLMGSLDAATGVRHAVRGVVDLLVKKYAAGTFLATHTLVCIASVAGLLAATVIVRIGIEMRRSRAAMTFLAIASISYMLSASAVLGLFRMGPGELPLVFESTMKLAGDLALLFSTLTYARYVFLDAQGAISSDKAKRKKARKKSEAKNGEVKAGDDNAKDDAKTKSNDGDKASAPAAKGSPVTSNPTNKVEPKPPVKPSPALSPIATGAVKPAAVTKASADDEEDDDADDDSSGMSRAERKKLKKLARREMRNAA